MFVFGHHAVEEHGVEPAAENELAGAQYEQGGPDEVAAEQKARTTYDNILRLSDDPDVNDVIKFLRQREVVHFQRFGEAIQLLREKLDQKNVYYMNPAIDL